MKRSRAYLVAVGAWGLVVSCNFDQEFDDYCAQSGLCADGGLTDAGSPDSGAVDSGLRDSGVADSGQPDSGNADSGAPDAGITDAGPSDAGAPDAGLPDAGTVDSGLVDSGAPDAGTPDAGQSDAGTQDAGTQDAGPQCSTLSFAPGVIYASGPTNTPTALTVADVNGDGRPDSLVLDQMTGVLYIQLNVDGGLVNGSTLSPTDPPAVAYAVGDVGNGTTDIVFADSTPAVVELFRNDGSGHFTHVANYTYHGTQAESVAIGSIASPTSHDVVVGTATTLNLYNGTGGGLASQPQINITVPAFALVIADVNHDNAQDAVFVDGQGKLAVVLNDGGSLSNGVSLTDTSFASLDPYALAVGPLLGIGRADIAVGLFNSGVSIVDVDGGSLIDSGTVSPSLGVGAFADNLALGSFLNNGRLDIALADPNSTPLNSYVLVNQGGGTFTQMYIDTYSNPPQGVAVADINGDGKLDLLVLDQATRLWVYINQCN